MQHFAMAGHARMQRSLPGSRYSCHCEQPNTVTFGDSETDVLRLDGARLRLLVREARVADTMLPAVAKWRNYWLEKAQILRLRHHEDGLLREITARESTTR